MTHYPDPNCNCQNCIIAFKGTGFDRSNESEDIREQYQQVIKYLIEKIKTDKVIAVPSDVNWDLKFNDIYDQQEYYKKHAEKLIRIMDPNFQSSGSYIMKEII